MLWRTIRLHKHSHRSRWPSMNYFH
jgi:hypothetical protein